MWMMYELVLDLLSFCLADLSPYMAKRDDNTNQTNILRFFIAIPTTTTTTYLLCEQDCYEVFSSPCNYVDSYHQASSGSVSSPLVFISSHKSLSDTLYVSLPLGYFPLPT